MLVPLLVGVGLVTIAFWVQPDRTKYLLTAIGVLISAITLWKSFLPVRAEQGLDELVDLLALAMRNDWTRAASDRRILQPAPLPIRWRRTTERVAGPTTAATLTRADHTGIEPLPGLTRIAGSRLRSGTRRDLHRIYGGLASGRLLIIGGPGTGKSAAAILLLLDALKYRDQATPADRTRIPVPVLFTLQNWDPATTAVDEWLSTRLSEIPLFRGRRGKHSAATLLRAGRIAVFLDGLDEIPTQTQPLALQALSEQTTYRLVLITRTTELVTASQHRTLTGALAVELQPLRPGDVATYLLRPLTDPAPPAWHTLTSNLTQPNSALAQALTTPLSVSLLRDTYQPTDPVDELCDKTRFPTPTDITNHLLDHIITATYTPRPGQPPPRYTPQTAQRTLALVARQLNSGNSRDLQWWTIPEWIPFRSRAVTVAILCAIASGFTFGHIAELKGTLLIGLAAGLLSEFSRSETPKIVRRMRWKPQLSAAEFRLGFADEITSRFMTRLALTLTIALTIGLGFGLTETGEVDWEPGSRQDSLPSARLRSWPVYEEVSWRG